MIELKNISYAYPGQPPLLQNISTLKVPVGTGEHSSDFHK